MTGPIRIAPEEVRQKVISGSALLVCAYEDIGRFEQVHLKGAISLPEFRSRISSLAKGHEIIFYCA